MQAKSFLGTTKSFTRPTAARPAAGARQPVQVQAVARGAGPGRPGDHWCPGTPVPEYLDGSLPGDFGFDPIGLGKDPKQLAWYAQAELIHARFAMLGITGIALPEIAADAGFKWAGAGVDWQAAAYWDGYFAPIGSIFITQLFLMGWAEQRRYNDILVPGSANQDPAFPKFGLPDGQPVGYPGGAFDPLGYSGKKGESNPELSKLKHMEMVHGRLAMQGMLGIYVQANVVGGTPMENLYSHLASPAENNILSTMSNMFIWDYSNLGDLQALAPGNTGANNIWYF